jgi:hypothetical protein
MTALDDLDNFFKKVNELFPEEDTYAKQHSPEQSYETRLNPITIIINDIPFQAIEASLTREFEDSPLTHTGFRCQGRFNGLLAFFRASSARSSCSSVKTTSSCFGAWLLCLGKDQWITLCPSLLELI